MFTLLFYMYLLLSRLRMSYQGAAVLDFDTTALQVKGGRKERERTMKVKPIIQFAMGMLFAFSCHFDYQPADPAPDII